jgi:hypothetical protein
VVGPDTLPPALRASDEDRDHVIAMLRAGAVSGQLSHDTFVHRMEAALQARGLADLAGLLKDLPPPARKASWLERAIWRWSAAGARVQLAWRTPRLPSLVLPRADRVFVIGRSPQCDLAIGDMTVSWRHAELRRGAGGWQLTDLGSTNGTRVNGWLAGAGFTVQPGDRVSFGGVAFRVCG